MAELTQAPQTKINISLSYKVNMGNYETMDFHVGIEDFTRNGENANQAFERVYGFLEDKLIEKVTTVKDTIK